MRVSEIKTDTAIELLNGEKGSVSKIVGNTVRVKIPGEDGHRELPAGHIGEKSDGTLVEIKVKSPKITEPPLRQSRDVELHSVTMGDYKTGEHEHLSDALMELVEHLINLNNQAEDYIESLKRWLDEAGVNYD